MVPADPEAERVILEAGFHSVGLDWQESLGDHKIRGDYSGMAGTSQQHSDINNILMMATAEVLAAGRFACCFGPSHPCLFPSPDPHRPTARHAPLPASPALLFGRCSARRQRHLTARLHPPTLRRSLGGNF